MELARMTKTVGGGTSWYYVMVGGKVLDAAHELDKEGMERLRRTKQAYNKEGE